MTAVLSKDVQLQSLFMHFCLPGQLLILCINSGSMIYTHTTYPVLPPSMYLNLAGVKHRRILHLPPLQQQQLREDIAALPLWEVRDTWRGWVNCTYKSHSSAPSSATRSLRNADSRQAKNRQEGTPLEPCAHTAVNHCVLISVYSPIAVYFIKKMQKTQMPQICPAYTATTHTLQNCPFKKCL